MPFLVKVLYYKLPTISKKLPTFPPRYKGSKHIANAGGISVAASVASRSLVYCIVSAPLGQSGLLLQTLQITEGGACEDTEAQGDCPGLPETS